MQTMMRIDNFLAQNMISGFPKMIIWAHNSHVGDVRASSIGKYERVQKKREGNPTPEPTGTHRNPSFSFELGIV